MKNKILIFALALILAAGLAACSKGTEQQKGEKTEVNVGEVKMNAHPSSLEGKTVLLRWNSKLNGNKVLDRVAELLTQKVPGVKIIKMYQVDPSTVGVSENMEKSLQTADKIAAQKPDIVIASQADCGHCTEMLVIDQLNVEKKGIPTVTITTTGFEALVKKTMNKQGVSEMSLVVVEHPIAGRNDAELNKLVDGAFDDIVKAATQWQPSK